MVALAPSMTLDGIWSCKWSVMSSKPWRPESGLGSPWSGRPEGPDGPEAALVQGLVSNRDSEGPSCHTTLIVPYRIELRKCSPGGWAAPVDGMRRPNMCGWNAHHGGGSPTTSALLFGLLYLEVYDLAGGRRGGPPSKQNIHTISTTRATIAGNPKFP